MRAPADASDPSGRGASPATTMSCCRFVLVRGSSLTNPAARTPGSVERAGGRLQVHPRALECRQEAEYEAGEERDEESERERGFVHAHGTSAREIGGREGEHRRQRPGGEE